MNNNRFEDIIKYRFKDKSLLTVALTHSSFSREQYDKNAQGKRVDNQRLEFLGDAYFDAIISRSLFNKMSSCTEGKLSKTRALVVCENSLAKVGERLRIGEFLNLGKSEEASGGRNKKSIIGDAVEALIGAIFLDGGYDAAEEFVLREFETIIEEAKAGKIIADYKTKVQEILQSGGKCGKIVYNTEKEEGPDHDKMFFVHLSYNDNILGRGQGKTKKEAEQNAAKAALEGGKI